jgi:hypothetical protein
MTKGWVTSSLLLALGLVGSGSASADDIKNETGRLAKLISELASSAYVLAEPAVDDRPYIDPSAALHDFRHVAAALMYGDVDAAARAAKKLDYEVVKFTDSQTERDYYVLREDLEAVKTLRGWGSYIVNRDSRVEALVEVPHPMADVHTPEIGGLLFAECQAKGFLLAGAHREKADVPDLVDSIFHQVHAAWVGPFARVTAWQIHGFSSTNHDFPRGAQVVASTGDGEIVPEVAALDSVLEQRGLVSYVFNELPATADKNRELNGGVPGVTFTSLAGAKNEQGRLSRSLGGSFVHIELEGNVRASAANRRLAASAIAAVIAKSPSEYPEVRKGGAAAAQSSGETKAIVLAAEAAERPSSPEVVRLAAKPVNYRANGEPLPETTAP